MNDWRGREITVGCTIIYPCRVSSSVWLNEAVVEEVHSNKLIVAPTRSTHRWRASTGRSVTLTALERVTVVPA